MYALSVGLYLVNTLPFLLRPVLIAKSLTRPYRAALFLIVPSSLPHPHMHCFQGGLPLITWGSHVESFVTTHHVLAL